MPRAAPAPVAIDDDFDPAERPFTFVQNMRGAVRLAGFLLVTCLMIPFQWVFVRLKLAPRKAIPFRFHRLLCWILGIRVTVTGRIAGGDGLLIAANHTSWLDIPVMSVIGPVSFIAKSQVARWPFFGLLGSLQETVYVERERTQKTADQRDQIRARIAAGDTIILFPEGTSNDGNKVLPFKSALLSVAEGALKRADGTERPIQVQPMTVAYTTLRGLPMTRQFKPFFAWYGDMDMVPHLWDAVRMGGIGVEIVLHPALTAEAAGGRKDLTRHCEETISAELARRLAGRAA
jgi:lyso-ornithine lipid O-acyltransferase